LGARECHRLLRLGPPLLRRGDNYHGVRLKPPRLPPGSLTILGLHQPLPDPTDYSTSVVRGPTSSPTALTFASAAPPLPPHRPPSMIVCHHRTPPTVRALLFRCPNRIHHLIMMPLDRGPTSVPPLTRNLTGRRHPAPGALFPCSAVGSQAWLACGPARCSPL
jgi:hypothetical protein